MHTLIPFEDREPTGLKVDHGRRVGLSFAGQEEGGGAGPSRAEER